MDNKVNTDVEILKALAHPIRLAIVRGLSDDGCNVGKMANNLGISQPIISQQLNKLKKAKIIKGHRNGNQICYSVVNQKVERIIKALKE